MEIKNVTIAGAGVMGSQIAWQIAFSGFNVTVYDVFEKGLEKAKKLHEDYAKEFVNDKRGTQKEVDDTLLRFSYTSDMEEAFKNADLVNESIPENIAIKTDFWSKASKIAGEDVILTSNSSTFLPSELAKVVEHPSRFSTLHFWSGVWKNNLVEIMGHNGTDQQYNDTLEQFAKTIDMVPIPIKKEQPGYVTNSLLVPFLVSALKLYYNSIADFKVIDKVWMIPNGRNETFGPFAHIDNVGINVTFHICENLGKEDEEMKRIAKKLKEDFIDKGNFGRLSGQGFYTYPNPEFEDPNFLK